MKRLIAGFMTVLMALLPLVSAFGLPQPISGHIHTFPEGAAGDLTVIAESLRTGGTLYAIRSGADYLVEAANMPGGYAQGDTIRVTIIECADKPACVKEVVGEGHPIELDFDLREDVCLPCPVCSPCDECCPTTTTTVCPYCEECPLCEFDILTAFISAIIGGFAVYVVGDKIKLDKKSVEKLIAAMPKGCGLRLFHSYAGTSDLKHYHRSPNKYHDLSDRHKEGYDHNGEENLFPDFD